MPAEPAVPTTAQPFQTLTARGFEVLHVSLESLAAAGVTPTPKQRANIQRRVSRGRDPVDFPRAWVDNFVSNKYGAATTHWNKLMHRVERGVGNPCPLLLIGLPASIVVFDDARVEKLGEEDVSTDPADASDQSNNGSASLSASLFTTSARE